MDIFISNYNEKAIEKDFGAYLRTFNFNQGKNRHILPKFYNDIINKQGKYEEYFFTVIKRNNAYIEREGYNNISLENLEKDFSLHMLPAHHGDGVSPEMIILYYYSKYIFSNEVLDLAKKSYLESLERFKNYNPKPLPEKIEIETRLEKMKEDINAFFYEDEVENLPKMDFEKIAEKLKCNYDKERKVFDNVKRGVVLYVYARLDDLHENVTYNSNLIGFLSKGLEHVNRFAKQQETLVSNLFEYKNKKEEYERKNKLLNRELKEYKTLINNSKKGKDETDDKKTIEKLMAENYYLKTRIEKLEKDKAALEEEKKINEEIHENLTIEEKVIEFKNDLPEYCNIIVIGGKWNSKSKEEVDAYLSNNTIEFIEADKTIRKSDKIENADIVIFDTSLNAHKYYYRVRDISKKMYLINKSNVSEVKEIFEK